MPDVRVRRRTLLRAGVAASGVAILGAARSSRGVAQGELVTASGAGVNLKLMPDENGKMTVPLREPFAFDAHYEPCVVEDNMHDLRWTSSRWDVWASTRTRFSV